MRSQSRKHHVNLRIVRNNHGKAPWFAISGRHPTESPSPSTKKTNTSDRMAEPTRWPDEPETPVPSARCDCCSEDHPWAMGPPPYCAAGSCGLPRPAKPAFFREAGESECADVCRVRVGFCAGGRWLTRQNAENEWTLLSHVVTTLDPPVQLDLPIPPSTGHQTTLKLMVLLAELKSCQTNPKELNLWRLWRSEGPKSEPENHQW